MALNNIDKRRPWADLTPKRQIEYLKDAFCIGHRNGYKKVFFVNSEEISRHGNLTIMAGADRFP